MTAHQVTVAWANRTSHKISMLLYLQLGLELVYSVNIPIDVYKGIRAMDKFGFVVENTCLVFFLFLCINTFRFRVQCGLYRPFQEARPDHSVVCR